MNGKPERNLQELTVLSSFTTLPKNLCSLHTTIYLQNEFLNRCISHFQTFYVYVDKNHDENKEQYPTRIAVLIGWLLDFVNYAYMFIQIFRGVKSYLLFVPILFSEIQISFFFNGMFTRNLKLMAIHSQTGD